MVENSIRPFAEYNNIPIVFCTDNNFVGYFSVALQSIIDTSNKNFFYDIIVFEDNLNKIYKHIIQNQVSKHSNFSIRYIEANKIIEKFNILSWYKSKRLTHVSYYRLFIPFILKHYKKIIYLDCDILVQSDIAELYKEDIEGSFLGAVKNFKPRHLDKEDYYIEYLQDTLHLHDLSVYFNAGVLLLNLYEMINENIFEKFLNIASTDGMQYDMDQGILNSVCQGFVTFLDNRWNVQWSYQKRRFEKMIMPPEEYAFLLENAKVFHYVARKPNTQPDDPYALQWWQIARKTEFREQLAIGEGQQKAVTQFKVLRERYTHLAYATLQLQASKLAGKEVYFWGCGAAYKKFRHFFNDTRPQYILVDIPNAPQSVDGIPVKHPSELQASAKKLPVVVFTSAAYCSKIMKKLNEDYSFLVAETPILAVDYS